jgi:hypothetical protein
MTGDLHVVAYAICRQCAAVFPSGRRCPRCDDDAAAAEAIAAATAHAMEPAAQLRARRERPMRPPRVLMPLVGVTALMLGLGVGLAWLITHEARADAAPTTSTTSSADR